MLTVKDCRNITITGKARFGIVLHVALVIVLDEVVELEVALVLGLNLPEQEGPDRITGEQRVKELDDLLWLPDEFPLDRGAKTYSRL
ncbi:hypothetical protein [Candidatus Amarolinea dominans]|uniref:hypothetical protein n=1 Tax=Candidatus Amarolinea dominans TaxID=3140696 RepID=UPI0031CC9C4C